MQQFREHSCLDRGGGGLCLLPVHALSRTPRHTPALAPICVSEHCAASTLCAARRAVTWQAQLSAPDPETHIRKCASEYKTILRKGVYITISYIFVLPERALLDPVSGRVVGRGILKLFFKLTQMERKLLFR